MLTDVGVVRDHNEDSAYADDTIAFFVVADGMGGHAAGEVASAMAVDGVKGALEGAAEDIAAFAAEPSDEGRQHLIGLLETAVREAHRAVYERGTNEADKQGMGTTLDVVLVAGAEAFVAHVGDSRTYLLRDGKAAQITTDHTVAEVLVIEGKLSIEEAQVSPLRTILVNAIGVAPEVGVEMAHVRLRKGDRLLLCSDGLHDYFPGEQEIADRITDREPEEALSEMIELAKTRGGHDNITGVLLEVVEAPAPEPGEGDDAVEDLHAAAEAIPQEIARDDTLPVDAGTLGRRPPKRQTRDTDKTVDTEATTDPGAEAQPDAKDDEDTKTTVELDVSELAQRVKADGPDGDADDDEADAESAAGDDDEAAGDDDEAEAESAAADDDDAAGDDEPAEDESRPSGDKGA